MSELLIHTSADGIGDAICGAYVGAGMAAAGHEVRFLTRHPEWLARLSAPGLTIARHDTTVYGHTPGANMNRDYLRQLKQAESRKQWYADAVADHYGVKPFAPAAPVVDKALHGLVDLERVGERGYVVLAPFSAGTDRRWPRSHWRRLAALLVDAGLTPVALGARSDTYTANEYWRGSGVQWWSGEAPNWIAELLLECAAFVGNDSGLTHLAGALGVPTLGLHAQLPAELLWSQTEVVGLAANTPCVLCRCQRDLGYRPPCLIECAALGTIGAEQVAAQVEQLLSRGVADTPVEVPTRATPTGEGI